MYIFNYAFSSNIVKDKIVENEKYIKLIGCAEETFGSLNETIVFFEY